MELFAKSARWLMAVSAVLLGFAGTSNAQVTRGVAFCRDNEVMFLRPGAKAPEKLGKGMYPAVSPNGSAVAFAALTGTNSGSKTIRLVTLGGGNRTLYTAPGEIKALLWSPTGAQLAFLMDAGSSQELYTLTIPALGNPGKPTLVIRGGQYGANAIFMPRWFPDGQGFLFHDIFTVFHVNQSGKFLEKVPVAKITGKANNVDSLGSFVANPTHPNEWAYIAMVQGTPKFTQTFGEPCSALFVLDRSTGKRVRLTPVDMVANDPIWSPDGKFLYLVGYREPHYKQQFPFRIYRVNRDGSGLTELGKGEQPST